MKDASWLVALLPLAAIAAIAWYQSSYHPGQEFYPSTHCNPGEVEKATCYDAYGQPIEYTVKQCVQMTDGSYEWRGLGIPPMQCVW